MDENPYQSPDSVPGNEQRPTKRPSAFDLATISAFCGFMASIMWLSFVSRHFGSPVVPRYMELPMAMSIFLIPLIVALAMARWAWRHPESKWVFPVVVFLIVSGLIPPLIDILLFGFRW